MSSNSKNASTTDTTSQSAPADQNGPMDMEAARRVEDKKLTRRAALRKLGYGAGIAAFSLLGVDDFARIVGERLARHSGDSKVAQAVAQEFKQAGIVLASPTGSGTNLPSNCAGATVGNWCYNRYTTTSERENCCRGTLSSGGYCKNATGGDVAACIGNVDYPTQLSDCKGCCSQEKTLCQGCCDNQTGISGGSTGPRGKCYLACDRYAS